MKIFDLGPASKRRAYKDKATRWSLLVMALGFVVCGIVNLCVGGQAWSLFVLISEYIFFTLALDHKPVDEGFIRRWTKSVTGVCLLFLVIEFVGGTRWASTTVVPVISFGALIVAGGVYYLDRKRQRHNIIPLLKLFVWAVIMCVVCAVRAGSLGWPLITLLSVIGVMPVVSAVFFRRQLKCELQKKINI